MNIIYNTPAQTVDILLFINNNNIVSDGDFRSALKPRSSHAVVSIIARVFASNTDGRRVRKLTSSVERYFLAIVLPGRAASEHGAAFFDARLSRLRLRRSDQQPEKRL